jgi:CheY-like chemotaxis protein
MSEHTDARTDGDGGTDSDTERPGDTPTILVVDDEPRVVEAFELWLGDAYRIVPATSGSEALDCLDDSVDLVLLDRHMPGMHGDEVLAEIRDRGQDCRVAMVTAVDPDFDILEMPFDHYIAKPVDEQKLRQVVERLLGFESYDRQLEELYTVTQKLTLLEQQKPRVELRNDDRYQELRARMEQLQEELDEVTDSLATDEFENLFQATEMDN